MVPNGRRESAPTIARPRDPMSPCSSSSTLARTHSFPQRVRMITMPVPTTSTDAAPRSATATSRTVLRRRMSERLADAEVEGEPREQAAPVGGTE
jgi:hypothetical protein